ncbi:MAG: ATP-binding protein [Gallionella sp.]|nr:ATP-binding protein [Gallionella sp.]
MTLDELKLIHAAYRASPGNPDLALLLASKLAALQMWPELLDNLDAWLGQPVEKQPPELAALLIRALLETARLPEAEAKLNSLLDAAPDYDVEALLAAFEGKGLKPRRSNRQRSVDDPMSDLSDFRPLDLKTRSQVSFAQVGGLDALKEAARMKIILPFQKPELFAKYGKKAGGGLLLYGPPGCGKTHFAKAVAGECGAAFFNVGIHDILNLYVGNSERNMRRLFETARSNKPAILFIDEIDALGRKRELMRHSGMTTTINAFLNELDGVGNDNAGLLVMGATNAPWDIDSAFKRPGRFDQRLFVPPPDLAARESILRIYLADKPVAPLDLAQIARNTEHFSGADLAALVSQAADIALTEILKTGRERPIDSKDIASVLKQIKPSTLEWLAVAKNYVEYANEEGSYDEIRDYLAGTGGKRRMGF